MPTHTDRILPAAIAILALAAVFAAPAGADGKAADLRDTTLDFDAAGLQPGSTVPSLEMYTADGDPRSLATLWSDRPAVLVTVSLTCPVARRKQRHVERLQSHFGDQIRVALLYTLEAHPTEDGSPYSIGQVEWRTKANIKQNLLFRQPTGFTRRVELAERYVEETSAGVELYFDGMDNRIWQTLGGGPHMALVVDTTGTLRIKHGWFDGETLFESIEAELGIEGTEAPVARTGGFSGAADGGE